MWIESNLASKPENITGKLLLQCHLRIKCKDFAHVSVAFWLAGANIYQALSYPSVSVCVHKILILAVNFTQQIWFHVHSQNLTLWHWIWSLIYFWNISNTAVAFKLEDIGLSNYTCECVFSGQTFVSVQNVLTLLKFHLHVHCTFKKKLILTKFKFWNRNDF